MARAIWKYNLPPFTNFGQQEVRAPEGAKFLSAAWQHNHIAVWYVCDPTANMVTHWLEIFPTGQDGPHETSRHLGTILLHDGNLVLHVFVQEDNHG